MHGILRRQRGLGLIGFIFALIVIATLFLVVSKAVPAHHEYFAVQKVLKDVANEIGENGTRAQFAGAFDRRAAIDDITAVAGRDLRIAKENGKTVLVAQYEKRLNLISYVSLVFEFEAKATVTATAK